jgi:hypothetical protein
MPRHSNPAPRVSCALPAALHAQLSDYARANHLPVGAALTLAVTDFLKTTPTPATKPAPTPATKPTTDVWSEEAEGVTGEYIEGEWVEYETQE